MSEYVPTREPASPAAPPSSPTPVHTGGPTAERLALDQIDYPIAPEANRIPYMLGGLTFFGILILILTGIVLDQFYNPAPVGAHDSIVYTMTKVPLGNWIRGLHYWGASAVLVSVILHLVWVFWRRSYTRPREVTWWSGVLLLLLITGLAFTGTVLRADQEGGEALAHAVAGAGMLGPLGTPFSPDFALSTTLLARMHNVHVSVLPLLLLGLVGLHFWLIRYLGIHSTQPKTSVFSTHLRLLTGYGFLLIGALGVLAAVSPAGIGHPAIAGTEVTKPFWPFLWIYAVENTLGMVGMLVAPLVIFGFLFLVPFFDRGRGKTRPTWFSVLAGLFLVLFVGAFVYGIFAPQMQHLGM